MNKVSNLETVFTLTKMCIAMKGHCSVYTHNIDRYYVLKILPKGGILKAVRTNWFYIK